MRMYSLIAIIVLCITFPVQAENTTDLPSGTYTLDKSHASLVFSVSHLGFTLSLIHISEPTRPY